MTRTVAVGALCALLTLPVVATPQCDASRLRDLFHSYADAGRDCLDAVNQWGWDRALQARSIECRAMRDDGKALLEEYNQLTREGCTQHNWVNGPRREDVKYAQWMRDETIRLLGSESHD